MSKIEPRTITKEVNHHDLKVPLCWNGTEARPPQRNEVVDQPLGIYQSGPDRALVREIVTSLERARSFVCVSTFVLQQSEITQTLLNISKQGVRVYLLTASENQLEKEDHEMTEFDRRVVQDHKELLQSFAGRILVRTADHFHAKFILIDPSSPLAHGYLLTANLTRGALYENVKFEGNEYQCNFELGLRLTREQITGVFRQFIFAFWHEAQHELFEAKTLAGVGKPPFSIPLTRSGVLRTVGDERSLKKEILNIIDTSTSYLVLSAWSFDQDHEVLQHLLRKARDGVNISILTRVTRKRTMPALTDLIMHGATIYGHERLHGKFIIGDGTRGMVLTANFTRQGLDSGFETGISLTPPQINSILELCRKWMTSCTWKLEDGITRKDVREEALIWTGTGLEEKPVRQEYVRAIPLNSRSMNEYLNPTYELPEPPRDSLYLRSRFEITVNPPRCPSRAKPLDPSSLSKTNEPDQIIASMMDDHRFYRDRGETYIEVSDDGQIPRVTELEKRYGWIGTVPL